MNFRLSLRKAYTILMWAGCAAVAFAGPVRAGVTARSHDSDLAVVRDILQLPEASIDLAKAKLAIDRLIDPSIDVAATLSQLDAMATGIRATLPPVASKRLTMDALRYHLYEPSSWNGNHPFQYDLDDPFGANLHNKLISTYMTTRKGNCVSMPLLFIILGQKLGIDVTAALAPNHVFVKYRDDSGASYNLETTSGAGFTRDAWMNQQFAMSDEAIRSGIYMRALNKKETVVVMVGTLLEFYNQQGLNTQGIEMSKLARTYSPSDVSILLLERQAYRSLWQGKFVSKYASPSDIPIEKRSEFTELEAAMKRLYEQAYALGWRPLDRDADESYRQRVVRAQSIR